MKVRYTPRDLMYFEDDIADCFNDKQIRAPIHLYHGCEEPMIDEEALPFQHRLIQQRQTENDQFDPAEAVPG